MTGRTILHMNTRFGGWSAVLVALIVGFAEVGCGGAGSGGSGGRAAGGSSGGSAATGGAPSSGGSSGAGGLLGSGGHIGSGGRAGAGGISGAGGSSPGGTTGSGGVGGQIGGSGGSGTGGSAGGEGFDAGSACDQISAQYATTIKADKVCQPIAGACQSMAVSVIGCPCLTPVQSSAGLDVLISEWNNNGCGASCPSVACVVPQLGNCTEIGCI